MFHLHRNLAQVAPLLEFRPRADWLARIERWKADFPFRYEPSEPGMCGNFRTFF